MSAPWARRIPLTVCLACLGLLAWLTAHNSPAAPIAVHAEWMREIGLNVSFWLDGPALFWAWLVLGIGLAVTWYAGYYMDPKDRPWAFYASLQLFMGSMLGLVTSRNALQMFLFWELTSLTSFFLIGHWHHSKSARFGALCALTVTGAGGLVMLGGLALLFQVTHTMEWPELWAMKDEIIADPRGLWALGFILVGAFTKSAQFPFHFWLPNAMEAPTPVSAYLHAATMVKAGIYLFGRLIPIYSGHEMWAIVGVIGVITMCIGGWSALHAYDLKQLLAHSTVSQLGLLTAYYGFGVSVGGGHGEHAVMGAVLTTDLLLVLSHALFKGGLFMLIGVIDHGTGTRDWRRLGGLGRHMWPVFILTAIGCASMAGVPPTLGFIAKELFLHHGLHLHTGVAVLDKVLPPVAVFACLFTVAYCLRMTLTPFLGKLRDETIHPHKPSFGFLFSPLVMIGACLVLGIWVSPVNHLMEAWINPLASAPETGFHLALYHDCGLMFFISLGLMAGGFGLFVASNALTRVYEGWGRPTPWYTLYNKIFLEWLMAFAGWVQSKSQSYSLRRNLIFIFVSSSILMAVSFGRIPSDYLPSLEVGEWTWVAILMTIMVTVGVVMAVVAKSNLMKLIAMSPVGMIVAAYFIVYAAPDLALTQLMIEATMAVAFLLLLYRLPQTSPEPLGGTRGWTNLIVALAVGGLFGLVTYIGAGDHPDLSVALSYIRDALPRGGGHNIVNVIIVDFRGIDTMGEITVLCIAAIGGLCMLRMGRTSDDLNQYKREEELAFQKYDFFPEGEDRDNETFLGVKLLRGNSLIFQTIVKLAPAAMLVFAAFLFLRGHNLPGGGFIAGLMTALAFSAYYLAHQVELGKGFWDKPMIRLLPLGLAFAMLTGLGAVLYKNHPFLTSTNGVVSIPWLGETHLATAALFDTGVFFVVVGSVLMLIRYLSQGPDQGHEPEH